MLVVDANVIIASLISKGTIFLLIKQLNRIGIRLVSPSFLKEELYEHFNEIRERSGLEDAALKYLISELLNLIEVKPVSQYKMFMKEAEEICSDKNDVPYLALSLSSGKAPIWSFDKRLKEDCGKVGIRVISSIEEVIRELSLSSKL